MKNSIRRLVGTLALAAIVIPWQTQAQEKKESPRKDAPPKSTSVMVRKLEYAKNLMHGIAVQDFDLLIKNSDALIQCREDVTWKLNDTEKYVAHSNDFLEQLQRIKAASKKKNIEGATLAYLDMTRTCIGCHDTLRQAGGNKKDD